MATAGGQVPERGPGRGLSGCVLGFRVPLKGTIGVLLKGTPLKGTIGVPLKGTLGFPLKGTIGIPLKGTIGVPLKEGLEYRTFRAYRSGVLGCRALG